MFAALAAATCIAAQPAAAQEDQRRRPQVIQQGEAFIIIDGQQLIVRTPQAVLEDDVIPSNEDLWAVRISDEMRSIIARLDSEEYVERQAATRALIDTREPHLQFYAVLSRDGLGPEARHRLLDALIERLLYAPRGALGIQMDTRIPGNAETDEVRIVDLIQGLPAERVLRIDDRITHIDGTAIGTSNELINLVQSRRPGDVVRVAVRRPRIPGAPGENMEPDAEERRAAFDRLEFTIELGSTDRLENSATGSTGRPTIDRARRMEADAAMDRFGPAVRDVPISGR